MEAGIFWGRVEIGVENVSQTSNFEVGSPLSNLSIPP